MFIQGVSRGCLGDIMRRKKTHYIYTIEDQQTGVAGSMLFVASSRHSGEASFTPTSSYMISRVKATLFVAGAPAAALLTAKLYSDSADMPGSLLGTSVNTVDGSVITTSDTEVSWDFDGVAVTSGIKYHIAITSNIYTTATDQYKWRSTPAGNVAGQNIHAGDEGTWSASTLADTQANFKVESLA